MLRFKQWDIKLAVLPGNGVFDPGSILLTPTPAYENEYSWASQS